MEKRQPASWLCSEKGVGSSSIILSVMPPRGHHKIEWRRPRSEPLFYENIVSFSSFPIFRYVCWVLAIGIEFVDATPKSLSGNLKDRFFVTTLYAPVNGPSAVWHGGPADLGRPGPWAPSAIQRSSLL